LGGGNRLPFTRKNKLARAATEKKETQTKT
jgi:hypothetical protein